MTPSDKLTADRGALEADEAILADEKSRGDQPSLVSGLDAVLFDLDGVIYRGPDLIEEADTAVAALRSGGTQALFVTNNASRPPSAVADHLSGIGVAATGEDVVTSAQAAAQLLGSLVPAGRRVLVAGSQHLRDEVGANGFAVVTTAAENPAAAVQGYTPELTMADLAEVAYAVQRGALWVATNTDPTRPTDLGLAPGAGALVDAVGQTLHGQRPHVAGKPEPALLRETLARVGSDRTVFVGDRLDTDIAGAHAVGMRGVLVLTGSHGKHDLLAAAPDQRPWQVIADLRGLFRPVRHAVGDIEGVQVGSATVAVEDGTLTLDAPLADVDDQLDALWALAELQWRRTDAGLSPADPAAALATLDRIH